MGDLKVEVDPAEVGLDPERLERIGRHFARYVDDGRLAGWLITVNRRGRLAYVATNGSRDAGAQGSGQPVHPVVRGRPGVHRRTDVAPVTAPATEPVRVWHLLTHTAGLT